jgi:hypothetical protein
MPARTMDFVSTGLVVSCVAEDILMCLSEPPGEVELPACSYNRLGLWLETVITTGQAC